MEHLLENFWEGGDDVEMLRLEQSLWQREITKSSGDCERK